jgi:hypothetical protein
MLALTNVWVVCVGVLQRIESVSCLKTSLSPKPSFLTNHWLTSSSISQVTVFGSLVWLECVFRAICAINGPGVVSSLRCTVFCPRPIALSFFVVLQIVVVVPDPHTWHVPSGAVIGMSLETYQAHLKQFSVSGLNFSHLECWFLLICCSLPILICCGFPVHSHLILVKKELPLWSWFHGVLSGIPYHFI